MYVITNNLLLLLLVSTFSLLCKLCPCFCRCWDVTAAVSHDSLPYGVSREKASCIIWVWGLYDNTLSWHFILSLIGQIGWNQTCSQCKRNKSSIHRVLSLSVHPAIKMRPECFSCDQIKSHVEHFFLLGRNYVLSTFTMQKCFVLSAFMCVLSVYQSIYQIYRYITREIDSEKAVTLTKMSREFKVL